MSDHNDYDAYDEEFEDDYDEEESISDILEESSQSWNEMFADIRKEFTELFEEYDEMVDEYGDLAEDDQELMQEEIAMQNVRLFAGMLINAGTSIGNFLSASAKLVSGELPCVHLHNESEKQVEDTYKAGEHLSIERGVYTHHGIYVGGGKVIHYSQGYDSVPEIREVSFKEFAGISKVSIVPEKDSPLRFTADEAVKRAYSRLGERSYNLVYNNCENFVRWCRAGC